MPQAIVSLGAFSNVASPEGQDPYFSAEDPASSGYLPPVYVFDNYSTSFSVVIAVEDTEPQYSVTSLTVSNNYEGDLFSYDVSGNLITITTGDDSPFDDYFQFMYYDENGEYAYRDDWSPSEAIANGFISIVKWEDPTNSFETVTHSVGVTAQSNQGDVYNTTITIRQGLYFKYPPYTEFVEDLSERSNENQANIIGPMIGVLTGDEYNYYVDDDGNILEYFVATENLEGINIGDTYIIVDDENVKFDPPLYLGNGSDFTQNGADLDTAKNLLIELGLYEGE